MSVAEIKNDLHRLIVETDDEEFLKKIQKVFNNFNAKKDWWLDLNEKDKENIDKGIRDIEEGNFTTNDKVKKGFREWIDSKL